MWCAGVLCPEQFSSVNLLQQHNATAHPYNPTSSSSSSAASSSSSSISFAAQTEPKPCTAAPSLPIKQKQTSHIAEQRSIRPQEPREPQGSKQPPPSSAPAAVDAARTEEVESQQKLQAERFYTVYFVFHSPRGMFCIQCRPTHSCAE